MSYYSLFIMFAGERIFKIGKYLVKLHFQCHRLDSHALEGEIDDYTKMGSECETKHRS